MTLRRAALIAVALWALPLGAQAQPVPLGSASSASSAPTAIGTGAPSKPPASRPSSAATASATAAPTARPSASATTSASAPPAVAPASDADAPFGPPPPPEWPDTESATQADLVPAPPASAAPATSESTAPAASVPTSSVAPAPATPATSATPAGSTPRPASSGAGADKGAPVRLYEAVLFTVQVPRGGKTAEQRAATASAAVRHAIDESSMPEVRVEPVGDAAVLLLGTQPVIELGPEDAAAAGAANAQVLATKLGADVKAALQKERSRNATLLTILSLAAVVFLGLIAVLVIRKAGDVTTRARTWIDQHPDRIPAIRFRTIEFVRPGAFRAALVVALSGGKTLAQIGVAYGWLLVTLSLFEPTRAYAQRLTGFVFGPLYELLGRAVGTLPLVVVAAIAAVALLVLVRFAGLLFESVARGETELEWLPADLAAPTSLLVRAGIVLVFFVLAAPLVTGDDGALSRAGTVALAAVALATTPLLSCAAVGATVVYGRRLRVGTHAEVAGRTGKVRAVTLLEVCLEDERGVEIRIPHLLGLIRTTTVLGPEPPVLVEVALDPKTAGDESVVELLRDAARALGPVVDVSLVGFDSGGARFRVTIRSAAPDAGAKLRATLARALASGGVALGRG